MNIHCFQGDLNIKSTSAIRKSLPIQDPVFTDSPHRQWACPVHISSSVFVKADTLARSPRQSFIFIIKRYLYTITASQKHMILFWKQTHWLLGSVEPAPMCKPSKFWVRSLSEASILQRLYESHEYRPFEAKRTTLMPAAVHSFVDLVRISGFVFEIK